MFSAVWQFYSSPQYASAESELLPAFRLLALEGLVFYQSGSLDLSNDWLLALPFCPTKFPAWVCMEAVPIGSDHFHITMAHHIIEHRAVRFGLIADALHVVIRHDRLHEITHGFFNIPHLVRCDLLGTQFICTHRALRCHVPICGAENSSPLISPSVHNLATCPGEAIRLVLSRDD